MKKVLTLSLVGTFALALTLTSNASVASAQPSAYGTAGCGLGSMLLGNKPGIMQIFAATTNGSFGSQTFGITFGTSNCTDSAGGVVSVGAFVETNREVVAKDISRGQGETIATLATLGGCSDQFAVGRSLQRNFGQIFPSSTVTDQQVSSSVISLLRADKSLRCKKLI